MEKSWWRRNALPLVAGVVLVAGALYSMVFTEWYNRYADEVVIAHAVATETAEYAGVEFGPATVVEHPRHTLPRPIPAGTRLLLVTTDINAPLGQVSCALAFLTEQDGGQRQWNTNFDSSWQAPTDTRTSCDPDSEGRQSVTFPFVIPSDATGPLTLQLQVAIGDLGATDGDVTLGIVNIDVDL